MFQPIPSGIERSRHDLARPSACRRRSAPPLAEGERVEILELTLGLMGHPRAINPDVPVVKRLRGRGLRRGHACRSRREHKGERDASKSSHGCLQCLSLDIEDEQPAQLGTLPGQSHRRSKLARESFWFRQQSALQETPGPRGWDGAPDVSARGIHAQADES
jgi:hypothetical protein